MSYSLLDRLPPGAIAEGQLAEGGANEWDSCGPATGSLAMQMYGKADIEPQDWINEMPGYGPNYHGGTTLQALAAFIASHYQDPPELLVMTGDALGLVQAYGPRDYPIIGWVWCDAGGNVLTAPLPSRISHFVLVLADDGSHIAWWNPMHGTIDRMTYADFDKASVGSVGVFMRPLPGGAIVPDTAQLRALLVQLAQMASEGHTAPTQVNLDAQANAIQDDLSNVNAFLAKVYDSDEARAWLKDLRAVVQLFRDGQLGLPGPKGDTGPKGDAGPPVLNPLDPSAFAAARHQHQIKGETT